MKKRKQTTRPALTLEASCTLRDAVDMQFQLLTAPGGSKQTDIDGSQVEKIDTAGLQLLVAFAQLSRKAGKPLNWCGVSDALARASQSLGLDEVLELSSGVAKS